MPTESEPEHVDDEDLGDARKELIGEDEGKILCGIMLVSKVGEDIKQLQLYSSSPHFLIRIVLDTCTRCSRSLETLMRLSFLLRGGTLEEEDMAS